MHSPQIRFVLISILFVAFLVPSREVEATPFPESTSSPDSDDSRIARAMTRYLQGLENYGFHGSALVAVGDRVLVHSAHGLADVASGRSNTPETQFSTGSVTKPLTATAILRLESEGKLSLSDTLSQHFDSVPSDKATITLHQLLSHSAGFRGAYGGDREEIEREAYVERVFNTPLEFPPGSGYGYSNAGYSLLAVIIEKISGKSWEAYLREVIYLPEEMENSGLFLVETSREKVACSHNSRVGYPSPHERTDKNWNLIGNGGQLSTPMDLFRWVRALQNDRLIPASSREKMFTRHVAEGGPYFYGYGWSIFSSPWGGDVIWHNGGAFPPGWSCAVYQYLEDDAIFIVFANKMIDREHPVDAIVEKLAGILHGDSTSLPDIGPDSSAVDLGEVSGEFDLLRAGRVALDVRRGRLQITPIHRRSMSRFFPETRARRFRALDRNLESLVTTTAEGRTDEARDWLSEDLTAKRPKCIEEWWSAHADLGTFEKVEILGTRAIELPITYARLFFSRGSRDLAITWSEDGKCSAIAAGPLPHLEFLPQSETRFVSYSVLEDQVDVLEFDPAGNFSLRIDGKNYQGVRVGNEGSEE